MHFAIDHVLAILDRTILNPVISAIISIGLQFKTAHRVIFQRSDDSILGLSVIHLPSTQRKALFFLAAGVLIRLNRYVN
jgi:hypothetical protein